MLYLLSYLLGIQICTKVSILKNLYLKKQHLFIHVLSVNFFYLYMCYIKSWVFFSDDKGHLKMNDITLKHKVLPLYFRALLEKCSISVHL